MRVLLVAPPGAGKGTQAAKLADHYGIANLSSGELLRREIAADSEIGREASAYVRRGDLVPDDLIFQVLAEPLIEAAGNGGYVLDGFPRNLHRPKPRIESQGRIRPSSCKPSCILMSLLGELAKRLLARGVQEGRMMMRRTS